MSATQTTAPVGASPSSKPGRDAGRPAQESGSGGAATGSPSTAVVPVDPLGAKSSGGANDEPDEFGPLVVRLPVELDVMVPVREFRVRSLLALEPGQVIDTQWGHGEDVPLAAGAVTLAWCEFEVIENQLAVRITRVS